MAEILHGDTVMVTTSLYSVHDQQLGKVGRVVGIKDGKDGTDSRKWYIVHPIGHAFLSRELTRFYSYSFLSSRSKEEIKGARPK